ncbi:MAG TPA: hypothetical protein ENG95_05140 [Nitrospirae bacterium]|nr:hypothetical protein [Nitrospirota bacterium]
MIAVTDKGVPDTVKHEGHSSLSQAGAAFDIKGRTATNIKASTIKIDTIFNFISPFYVMYFLLSTSGLNLNYR